MSTIKRNSLLFLVFLILFICSFATGVVQGDNQEIGKDDQNTKKECSKYNDLLTPVVAVVGIIALSGIYVQIMHKIEDNIRRIRNKIEEIKNDKSDNYRNNKVKKLKARVRKGNIILRLLGWQIILFFLPIFTISISIFMKLGGFHMGWILLLILLPFILSQIIHFCVFSFSYKKYLFFCKQVKSINYNGITI